MHLKEKASQFSTWSIVGKKEPPPPQNQTSHLLIQKKSLKFDSLHLSNIIKHYTVTKILNLISKCGMHH